jgi:hypothetical protein
MIPFLAWAREAVDPRLNGLLFNWYDADHAHYIGKHRDSTKQMITGAPIVTISLGATRLFRLRPWRGAGMVDIEVDHGSVLVIPFATNLLWTHEVPHRAADRGAADLDHAAWFHRRLNDRGPIVASTMHRHAPVVMITSPGRPALASLAGRRPSPPWPAPSDLSARSTC